MKKVLPNTERTMEAVSATTVSLDELMLDIGSVVHDEETQKDCSTDPEEGLLNDYGSKVHNEETQRDCSDVRETNITNYENLESINSFTPHCENSNDQRTVVTEGDINIEISISNHSERINDVYTESLSKHSEILNGVNSVEATEEPESDDDFEFEADVPPLSLFPKKSEDEEDSEFEFPEPCNSDTNQSSSKIFSSKSSCETDNKTVQFSVKKEKNHHDDVRIDSEHKENLEPEIFTPRDKVNSELMTTILPKKIKIDESTNLVKNFSEDVEESSLKQESMEDVDDASVKNKPYIVTTAEDWEQVQVVVPGFVDQKSKSGAAPVIESKPLAKFSESWIEISSLNYDEVKGNIKTKADRRGISALTHFLFGPPKLHKDLLPERELIFCLAATKFDNNSEVHNSVLQTVYRCLTGSKFDCQRYGSHWEEIGFQGQDPSTDLRGGGILSLLHLLYFLRESSTKELARDIYKLSLHPTQNFPFCVMSINITVQCLRVIREDVYNREFNKRKDVVGTMNCIYAALFLHMYQLWKKGKTIHDSGYILEEVANYSRKNCKTIFKDLESYERNGKDQNVFGDHPSANATFFNVCKEEKCDDKIAAELY